MRDGDPVWLVRRSSFARAVLQSSVLLPSLRAIVGDPVLKKSRRSPVSGVKCNRTPVEQDGNSVNGSKGCAIHRASYNLIRLTKYPLVGNVQDICACHALEQFHPQVVRWVDPGGPIADLAWILFGVVDKFLDRLDRHRGPDDEKILRSATKHQRREIPSVYRGAGLVGARICAERRRRAEQGVAVGCGLGDRIA